MTLQLYSFWLIHFCIVIVHVNVTLEVLDTVAFQEHVVQHCWDSLGVALEVLDTVVFQEHVVLCWALLGP